MTNYFNKLSPEEKLIQLGKCRFMDSSEFNNGVFFLKDKKIVIVGCGSQGLHQGLNMTLLIASPNLGKELSRMVKLRTLDSTTFVIPVPHI